MDELHVRAPRRRWIGWLFPSVVLAILVIAFIDLRGLLRG